ncbi:DMT family transporter [Saccharicrinis sp. FJH2]|uniref:DMT family transporter n=1 Tax=unclassified Saccharicrinis TaxID=2646859 RepID=UPI0035D461E7
MQKTLLLTGIALIMGGLIPVQSSLNAFLGQQLKSPLQATFINFAAGLLLSVFLLLFVFRVTIPSMTVLKEIPWYYYFGGFIGVSFVTMVVMLTPKIGITNVLAGALVGQLIISAIMDHFGLLNLNVHPITWNRVFGIIFLIVGIILTQK